MKYISCSVDKKVRLYGIDYKVLSDFILIYFANHFENLFKEDSLYCKLEHLSVSPR